MGLFGSRKERARQRQETAVTSVDVLRGSVSRPLTAEDRVALIRQAFAGLEPIEVVNLVNPLLAELYPDSLKAKSSPAPRPAPETAWWEKHVDEHAPNVAANADGILYGRTVSFTGDLQGMTRDDAAAAIASVGGVIHVNVTHETDVLVVGEVPGEKLERAQRYIEAGQAIEVVDEATLQRYLSGATFTSEGRERPPTNAELRAAARQARAETPRAVASPREPLTDRVIVDGVELVELVCRSCAQVWTRPPQRGRVPLLCPECRAAGKRA